MIEDPFVKSVFEMVYRMQAKKFGFEETNTYIENKGVKTEEQEAAEASRRRKKKTEEVLVGLGDILKPCISESGEFLGVQLRTDLATSVFL